MERFISGEKLARDSRFRRTRGNRNLLSRLPDDVDAIVAALEEAAPQIRARVEGTALEEVYDELGPAFQILSQTGQLRTQGDPNVALRPRLHGIYVGELQALEGAVYSFICHWRSLPLGEISYFFANAKAAWNRSAVCG